MIEDLTKENLEKKIDKLGKYSELILKKIKRNVRDSVTNLIVLRTSKFFKGYTKKLANDYVNVINSYIDYDYLKNDDEFNKFLAELIENKIALFLEMPTDLIAEEIGISFCEFRSEIDKRIEKDICDTYYKIIEFKCKKNNIPCYRWKIDSKSKCLKTKKHEKMENVIVFWEEIPDSKYLSGNENESHHAGCSFDCNCSISPVLSIDEIKFPVNIYFRNKIMIADESMFKQMWDECVFLNEARFKADKLISEVNFYIKSMYLLEDKIEKCTDQKLIIKTRKKINKLYSLIQHHKKALEELSDSIIIADE